MLFPACIIPSRRRFHLSEANSAVGGSARALSRSSAGAIENQARRFRWLVPVREVTAVFEPVQRCIREQLRGPRRLTGNGDLVLPPPSNDHFALE